MTREPFDNEDGTIDLSRRLPLWWRAQLRMGRARGFLLMVLTRPNALWR